MTAYTEHYSLPEYERGDYAALISGYNVSMEILDDLLFGFEQMLNGLNARVTALENELDDLEARVDALEEWQAEITVWKETVDDWRIEVNNKFNSNDVAWLDLLEKVFGGGTLGEDGHINFNVQTGKIPIADVNIFAGTANPTDNVYANALRSRSAVSENDVKLV